MFWAATLVKSGSGLQLVRSGLPEILWQVMKETHCSAQRELMSVLLRHMAGSLTPPAVQPGKASLSRDAAWRGHEKARWEYWLQRKHWRFIVLMA
eukprot:3248224-Rhodomonas_salina.2